MDQLSLVDLLIERDHHFGKGRVPPTPTTTPALIEYLHTLNALRIHLIKQIDTILAAANDYLTEQESSQLAAVRAGANALEGQQRWQLITFNWRRWVSN